MAQNNPKSKMRLDWEMLAKEYGIKDYDKLENKKLFRALQDKTPSGKSVNDEIARVKSKNGTANTSASVSTSDVEEVKNGEVLAPGYKSEHAVNVHAPQIHNHIASPSVTYNKAETPAWHQIVTNVWTIGLHMVLGAAVYAVVTHTGFTTVALLAGH